MAELVAGDETDLTLILVGRDGSRIDLTGGSVDLRYRIDGSTRQDVSMTNVTATEGVVRYRFGEGVLTAGRFTADVRATLASGQTFSNKRVLSLEVRKQV